MLSSPPHPTPHPHSIHIWHKLSTAFHCSFRSVASHLSHLHKIHSLITNNLMSWEDKCITPNIIEINFYCCNYEWGNLILLTLTHIPNMKTMSYFQSPQCWDRDYLNKHTIVLISCCSSLYGTSSWHARPNCYALRITFSIHSSMRMQR